MLGMGLGACVLDLDTIDHEHNISSLDRWSVGEDHTNFKGYAACMYF